ncbi:COMM domain-containing protein 9 [Manacus vitellinus]|nr:COMM domain-containing protein 9 [Manacus vitellinus]
MAALREEEFVALQSLPEGERAPAAGDGVPGPAAGAAAAERPTLCSRQAPSKDACGSMLPGVLSPARPPRSARWPARLPLARRRPRGSEQLVSALHNLTRHVVYRGLTRAEDILSLFPENFHQNLKNLLTKIILENISAWRNEAQASQISLPRLVDMDWRVDIKTSSDSIIRMAVPTCLLQLKIQEDAALCGNNPVVSALTVELSKETLDTMLEGLGRIRDQLSAVANK